MLWLVALGHASVVFSRPTLNEILVRASSRCVLPQHRCLPFGLAVVGCGRRPVVHCLRSWCAVLLPGMDDIKKMMKEKMDKEAARIKAQVIRVATLINSRVAHWTMTGVHPRRSLSTVPQCDEKHVGGSPFTQAKGPDSLAWVCFW